MSHKWCQTLKPPLLSLLGRTQWTLGGPSKIECHQGFSRSKGIIPPEPAFDEPGRELVSALVSTCVHSLQSCLLNKWEERMFLQNLAQAGQELKKVRTATRNKLKGGLEGACEWGCWGNGAWEVRGDRTGLDRTSLAAQWLRPHLPMQGVRVRSLVEQLRSHRPHGQNPKHSMEAAL